MTPGFPTFDRNHYFTGKLLTARDLVLEQDYLLNRLRLHRLALHGWGVVCGLDVKPHPHCPQKRLVVTPGLAVDPAGREIWVGGPYELDLPAGPPPPAGAARGWCPPDRVYSVCLRYKECPQEEQTPAPFDECGCPGHPYQHNRVRDAYVLTLETDPLHGPYPYPPAGGGNCEDADRHRRDKLLDGCPVPDEKGGVTLATLSGYAPGGAVDGKMIDPRVRRVLPSVGLLDDAVRCLLRQVSAGTHVAWTNWKHGQSVKLAALRNYDFGHGSDKRGLEIAFSGPRVRGFDPFSVQVGVVPHRDGRAEYTAREEAFGGPVERAHIVINPCEDTGVTRLHILFADDYLPRRAEHSFDVFVTVRCNLLVDEAGGPVAGQLRQRWDSGGYVVAPPTDQGPPGGAFESWFRVTPDDGGAS